MPDTAEMPSFSTIRQDMEASGKIGRLTFDEWLSEVNRLLGDAYGLGLASDHTGKDCWRGFYDDAYSPADAVDEDRSQWDE